MMEDGGRLALMAACRHESEAFDELVDKVLELKREIATLNLALFHVENGLEHPDEDIRLLIQAAKKVREKAEEEGTGKDEARP